VKIKNDLHGLKWHGFNGLCIIPGGEKDLIERSDQFILRFAKSKAVVNQRSFTVKIAEDYAKAPRLD